MSSTTFYVRSIVIDNVLVKNEVRNLIRSELSYDVADIFTADDFVDMVKPVKFKAI